MYQSHNYKIAPLSPYRTVLISDPTDLLLRVKRKRAAEHRSRVEDFAEIQEIELLSSVCSETRVCPSRMTDPAITRAGAARFHGQSTSQ